MPTVSTPARLLAALGEAVRAAGDREFVAALGGHRDGEHLHVVAVRALPNRAGRGDRFRVDPVAFAAAEQALRTAGTPWLGFVHSHPHGPPMPSATDRAELWRDCLQWIAAPDGDAVAVRAFWFTGERAAELPLQVQVEAVR